LSLVVCIPLNVSRGGPHPQYGIQAWFPGHLDNRPDLTLSVKSTWLAMISPDLTLSVKTTWLAMIIPDLTLSVKTTWLAMISPNAFQENMAGYDQS
jgi:hypothetical protein